jgi:mannose-6-phosphate isomerase
MYPLQLKPRVVEAIWGGNALVSHYGKPGDPNAKLGESWECWNENHIGNGEYEGKTVSELMSLMGPTLIGLTPLSDRSTFPILTKIIDAHESLSVQVHPGDEYARAKEHQPNGKTECWVVLEAPPGAELILGFNKDTDAAEYRKRVGDGSLGDILRRVPVTKGDVFHIPAGTLHAIGAGIVIFEAQQTSDVTYRIFDWNRVDANGKGRELHIDKAADVLDFHKSDRRAVDVLKYRLFGADRTLMIADARFGVEEIVVTTPARFLVESVATIFMAQDHTVNLRAGDTHVTVRPWESYLVPAGISRVEISSDTPGTKLFAITPPGADARARKRLELANIVPEDIESFLAQFGDR